MEYKIFIEHVQERAGLDSQAAAVGATRATLETLGERLQMHRTERGHLASQLPDELKDDLMRRDHTGRYLLEDFYSLVASRADVGFPDAVRQAQAVMGVLRQAIAPGEWEHIRSSLPDAFDELLGNEPPGPASPSRGAEGGKGE
jgi:uncharacterized protein (DUF2267 family)